MSKANRFELEVAYSTDKKISEEQVVVRLMRSLKKDDDDGWVVIAPLKTPPPANDMHTAFQNEPVNFLLSNALRHLTQDQQRELCNALQERLPVPASITDEADRLYPANSDDIIERLHDHTSRAGYITCARQYMDTIERLKAKIVSLEEELALYRLEK